MLAPRGQGCALSPCGEAETSAAGPGTRPRMRAVRGRARVTGARKKARCRPRAAMLRAAGPFLQSPKYCQAPSPQVAAIDPPPCLSSGRAGHRACARTHMHTRSSPPAATPVRACALAGWQRTAAQYAFTVPSERRASPLLPQTYLVPLAWPTTRRPSRRMTGRAARWREEGGGQSNKGGSGGVERMLSAPGMLDVGPGTTMGITGRDAEAQAGAPVWRGQVRGLLRPTASVRGGRSFGVGGRDRWARLKRTCGAIQEGPEDRDEV